MLKSKGVTLRTQRELQKSTLFVIAESEEPSMRATMRTMKAMRAMILGLPILNVAWIDECLSKKRLVPITAAHLSISLPMKVPSEAPGISPEHGLVRAAALLETHGPLARPFSGVGVFLVGHYKKGGDVPEKKDLVQILADLGAIVINTEENCTKLIR